MILAEGTSEIVVRLPPFSDLPVSQWPAIECRERAAIDGNDEVAQTA